MDDFILLERNKLWNDKNRLRVSLGLDARPTFDNANSNEAHPVAVNQLDSNSNQISRVQEPGFLESHQRKDNLKNNSPSTPTSETRMRTMVRHGEYSPLNPNLLSPGKFMLGLGEYEERRRLLMIQKKHEYKEYLSQVRLLVNSRNGTPSSAQLGHNETKQKPVYEDKYLAASNNNKSVQVSDDTSYIREHQNIPVAASATATITAQHKPIQSPIREPLFRERVENISNDAENQVELNRGTGTPDVSSTGTQHHLTQVENLSPRERKLADLQVSAQLSKMFFETSPETNPAHMSSTDIQARRQSHSAIYKEELRQQIEEKRKLDSELREKEKREEEAINRRVEEQQEKIRLEFLKEEKKKLEMQKQRLSDFEEFPDQRRKSVRDIRTTHEVETSRRLSNFEEPFPENLHSEHPILLPESETNTAHSISTAVQTIQPELLNDGLRQSINTSSANRTKKNHIEQELKVPPTTLPFRSKSFTIIDSTIPNDGTTSLRSPDGGSNRLWKPTDRNTQVRSYKTCNLEDSLPIPLFRSTSPVNVPLEMPATRTNRQKKATNNRTPETSQAMKKLEAKWQVPAVEKNNITRTTHQVPGGSRQKNVLTQLGAFRRQLQLEQMQTSEGLARVKPQRISK